MRYFYLPENALKRANELVGVGNKQAALESLHDVIQSKRHRQWQQSMESVLLRHMELCVELQKGRVAKDALHQYKNICQQMHLASMETVIRHLVKLSEAEAEKAREKATEAVVDIDDLEASETPESLILATVSGEDMKDRTDRLMLTPWLKFLWEVYRTVLDILRNNAKLEPLYQQTAQQAFEFCLRYGRKTEFRRLCELLRNHLIQVSRGGSQPNHINLNNPDSLQMHLETRFAQLNTAIKMELWQEAYRSIRDIHELLGLSRKAPKPQMMAHYYQALAQVLWMSKHYLFHACALMKLYVLTRDQKKSWADEDHREMATRVVLACLCVQQDKPAGIVDLYSEEDFTLRKRRELAPLLGVTKPPSREDLMADLRRQNILEFCTPEMAQLFNIMEHTFDPLNMKNAVVDGLNYVKNSEQYAFMASALEDAILMRILLQISQVYSSMKLSRLVELVGFRSREDIEIFLAEAVKQRILEIRINHRQDAVLFGTTSLYQDCEEIVAGRKVQDTQSERMRHHLSAFAKRMHEVSQMIKPITSQARSMEKVKAVQNAHQQTPLEHKAALERKLIIERRRQEMETYQMMKEKEEMDRRLVQKQMEQQAELQRLEEESKRREQERMQKEKEEMDRMTTMQTLKQLQKTAKGSSLLKELDPEEVAKLTPDQIVQKQLEQLDQEKKELAAKLRVQERKIDHMERAKRLVEIPLRQKEYEEWQTTDKERWEARQDERQKEAEEAHRNALANKERISRMLADKEQFQASLLDRRREEYEQKLANWQNKVERVKKERKEQLRQQRAREEQERRERSERERREREERDRREAEERKRKEEEAKRREEEEREYRERMAKLDEIERKKRAKEAEAMARQREEASAAGAGRPNGMGAGRQPVAVGGGDGGSWRRDGPPSARGTGGGFGGDRRGATPRAAGDEGTWRRRDNPAAGGSSGSTPSGSTGDLRSGSQSSGAWRRGGGSAGGSSWRQRAAESGAGADGSAAPQGDGKYRPPVRRGQDAGPGDSGPPPSRAAAGGSRSGRGGYNRRDDRGGSRQTEGSWR
eukprot:Clim_evm7s61 gene=Clim_evmTU7s61